MNATVDPVGYPCLVRYHPGPTGQRRLSIHGPVWSDTAYLQTDGTLKPASRLQLPATAITPVPETLECFLKPGAPSGSGIKNMLFDFPPLLHRHTGQPNTAETGIYGLAIKW